MTKQPEAIECAAWLENAWGNDGTPLSTQWELRAAGELRRLHEVNAELLAALNGLLLAAGMKDPQPWRDARADVVELLRKSTGGKE